MLTVVVVVAVVVVVVVVVAVVAVVVVAVVVVGVVGESGTSQHTPLTHVNSLPTKMLSPSQARGSVTLQRRYEGTPSVGAWVTEVLCAVRVPGEPVLTTATMCGTVVGSSLGSARLLQ